MVSSKRAAKENRIASEKSLKNFLTKANEYDIMIKLLRATKSNQKKLFQKSLKKLLTKAKRFDIINKLFTKVIERIGP